MRKPILGLRKFLGLSTAALAKEIGITQSAVTRYEIGDRRPEVVIAARIVELAYEKGFKTKEGRNLMLEDIYQKDFSRGFLDKAITT